MALVLGVKIGEVVDIAENWIAVLSVDSHNSATLIANDGQKIRINSADETEVAPDVWVCLGLDRATSRLRLQIKAPKSVAITRRREQVT